MRVGSQEVAAAGGADGGGEQPLDCVPLDLDEPQPQPIVLVVVQEQVFGFPRKGVTGCVGVSRYSIVMHQCCSTAVQPSLRGWYGSQPVLFFFFTASQQALMALMTSNCCSWQTITSLPQGSMA